MVAVANGQAYCLAQPIARDCFDSKLPEMSSLDRYAQFERFSISGREQCVDVDEVRPPSVRCAALNVMTIFRQGSS